MDAREEILSRLRRALADEPPAEGPPPGYRTVAPEHATVDRLVDRLEDYRATVHRCAPDSLPATVAEALAGAARIVVPADLPAEWLAAYQGEVRADDRLAVADLDAVDAVVTGCAVAIADTGTIVLDAGARQGRRAISLVPDHHVVVVNAGQIVGIVPEALPRLAPTRPQTWISGPSATSDIELRRVEGVHGPRQLHVVIVG